MTTYIDAKHVSAEIKRRLAAEFPGVRFSVRRGRGTGSASIDVRWADGPANAEVAAIAKPMQGSRWDGCDERYEATGNTVTVTIDGKRVTGSPVVDHISLHQEVSLEALAEATELWVAAHDGAGPAGMADGFMCEGEWIKEGWPANQVREVAVLVVLPRRWEAARKPAAPAEAPAQETPTPVAVEGLSVQHTDAEGITATGTRRGDGSAPALKAAGFTWHRKAGYWYLPATRGEDGAARLEAVRETLRASGLTLAPAAPQAPAGEPAPAQEPPAEQEAAPAAEGAPEPFAVEAAPVQGAPVIESGCGLEEGAHRVVSAGKAEPYGRGNAYLFRCLQCDQRAPLMEFDARQCTEEAERAHALNRATRLLDDSVLREAAGYVFTYALSSKTFPATHAQAVERLARLLLLGARHQWFAGELRLLHHTFRVASIKPAQRPAVEPAPQAYRGVPVPDAVAGDWGGEGAGAWRAGVDAALTHTASARPRG